MLQPSGLLTTHVTTISSRLGVLAQTRAATSTVTARQCEHALAIGPTTIPYGRL